MSEWTVLNMSSRGLELISVWKVDFPAYDDNSYYFVSRPPGCLPPISLAVT